MFSFEQLKGGLVVSCQAHLDHPLNNANTITELAMCANIGGAIGIRAEGARDIKAIKEKVNLPIIGIKKELLYDNRFFITPNFNAAADIVEAGASAIALEATYENQPDDRNLETLINRIQAELNVPVMADISTVEEGERAYKLGADVVSTTLSGYTEESKNDMKPNFDLLRQLVEQGIPTIFEGHLRTPSDAQQAMEEGALFCVVGSAITDPVQITQWFVNSISGER